MEKKYLRFYILYGEVCLQIHIFGSPGMPAQEFNHKEGHLVTLPKLGLIIVPYTQSSSDVLKFTFIWLAHFEHTIVPFQILHKKSLDFQVHFSI